MKTAERIALGLCAAAVLLALLGVLTGLGGSPDRASYSSKGLQGDIPAGPIPPPAGVIDVNGGDIQELSELPGIGETLSQAIIDEREARGPFQYPEDLLFVRGIGEKKLEAIRDLVDLTGSPDEEREE